ncbi:2-C-methyl-D-erythritol 4-phosphate cytidylyltransferase [Candidatus Woesearchaeota archaeon]|nr:2-C-methyl-D-erythritol 4-phosphate cytidylyltransferase [Candidatus Woesearchaeota archaeon]
MANKIIAIIPAGGEFLGKEKRNLALLDGAPLIKFTIDYAKSIEEIERVIVATNDLEISKYSKKCGAEVPFLLPVELSKKGVTLKEVLKTSLKLLDAEDHYSPDMVVFLEATHPLREKFWMKEMIKLVNSGEFDHVFLAKPEKDNFWKINETGEPVLLEETNSVRENKKPLFKELAGLGSVMKTEVIAKSERLGSKVGLVPIDDFRALVDIKTEEDLFIAEKLYEKHLKK